MHTKRIFIKVAGVTFDGRQETIAQLQPGTPYRITPEPDNPYDANALAVYVPLAGELKQVGYIPRDVAATLASILDGESITGTVFEITGGFEQRSGGKASYGLVLMAELPG